MTIDRAIRLLGAAVVVTAAGMGAFAALVLPYHHADALVFGRWSRLVELTGAFRFPQTAPIDLQRPLFYVTQGWIWRLFGHHESLGRLLALAFGIALLAAVVSLGRLFGGTEGALMGGLLLVLTPDYLRGIANGLTDVPVAAGIAVTARLLLARRQTLLVQVAVAVAAAVAVLTKPTALIAFAGLAVGYLILRRDAPATLVPLAAGMLAALAYDAVESHRVGMSLLAFLSAGTGGEWARLASEVRSTTLLQGGWLGAPLRLPLWFAAVYLLLRLIGSGHRSAARVALPVAFVGGWLLSALQASRPLGPLGDGSSVDAVAYVVFAVLLCFTLRAPEESAPTRSELAFLAAWALPVAVVWADRAVYATRLLSPAWPALALLLAAVLRPALAGARRATAPVAAAPLAAVAAFAALGLGSVDGLGTDGWHYLLASQPSGWKDGARMRRLVLGDFVDEVAMTQQTLTPGGRVLATDARLGFFFPRSLEFRYPDGCARLRGYDVFVLLLDSDSAAKMEASRRGASRVDYWRSCRDPRTRLLPRVSPRFAVFALPPSTVGHR